MPLYYYKAISPGGEVLRQEVSGDSRSDVVARIRNAGQIPVQVEEVRVGLFSAMARARSKTSGAGKTAVLSFTQELASLLEADIPLDRCLGIMQEIQGSSSEDSLVGEIRDAVRKGESLSQAMEARDDVFSKFYVSMVRTAESSGDLGAGLRRLLDYLERSSALRDQVISALIYPAILAAVSLASLVLILVFVVPQFAEIFADMGESLPVATRAVLGVSKFATDWGLLLIVLLLAALVAARRWLASPRTRRWLDRRILNVPLLGDLVVKLDVARFSRSLGTLLDGGVPLLRSLGIAADVLGNHVLADAVQAASGKVSSGQRLVDPLTESGRFPRLALQMIKVGEETGHLQTMLLKIADVYDREVTVATKRLLTMLEPLMIIVLGIAVAFIVISVLVGITSINNIPL